MLAGTKVRDLVEKHINGIGNITNLQSDASITYDDLWWAIEAKEDEGDGKVRINNYTGLVEFYPTFLRSRMYTGDSRIRICLAQASSS